MRRIRVRGGTWAGRSSPVISIPRCQRLMGGIKVVVHELVWVVGACGGQRGIQSRQVRGLVRLRGFFVDGSEARTPEHAAGKLRQSHVLHLANALARLTPHVTPTLAASCLKDSRQAPRRRRRRSRRRRRGACRRDSRSVSFGGFGGARSGGQTRKRVCIPKSYLTAAHAAKWAEKFSHVRCMPIKWMPMRCCALRVDSTRLHGSTASAFEDTVVTPDCVESYVDAPWDRAEGSPCWTITNI